MSDQELTPKRRAVLPERNADRPPRSAITLAILGLMCVAIGAVVGMAYDVVVQGGDTAGLVSIASIAVGALATIAGGAVNKRNTDDAGGNP